MPKNKTGNTKAMRKEEWVPARVLLDAILLRMSSKRARIHRAGVSLVFDGPFAETKERASGGRSEHKCKLLAAKVDSGSRRSSY